MEFSAVMMLTGRRSWRKEMIMKTGIIIHSHTNNTLSVGERLRDALLMGAVMTRETQIEKLVEAFSNADAIRG